MSSVDRSKREWRASEILRTRRRDRHNVSRLERDMERDLRGVSSGVQDVLEEIREADERREDDHRRRNSGG